KPFLSLDPARMPNHSDLVQTQGRLLQGTPSPFWNGTSHQALRTHKPTGIRRPVTQLIPERYHKFVGTFSPPNPPCGVNAKTDIFCYKTATCALAFQCTSRGLFPGRQSLGSLAPPRARETLESAAWGNYSTVNVPRNRIPF